MKTNELLLADLTQEELNTTNGGIVWPISLIGAIVLSAVPGAIILAPLAVAAYQGLNTYNSTH